MTSPVDQLSFAELVQRFGEVVDRYEELAGSGGSAGFDPGGSGLAARTVQGAILEMWLRLSSFLNPLLIQGGRFPANAVEGAVVGTLVGKLSGSQVVIEPLDARVRLSGGDASGYKFYRATGPVTAGQDFTVTVVETLGRARNTPRSSLITIQPVEPPPFDSIAGFGDSITFGQNATTADNRWLNRIAIHYGVATIRNKGIQGSIIQNGNSANGKPLANNGRDRFAADLLGADRSGRVYVMYGFNDARYIAAPATLNADLYENDLYETVLGLRVGGFAPDQLVLMTPMYITDTGLKTGSTGFSGQTREGFEAYVYRVRTVAAELGTRYADAYGYCRTNGAAALISSDNIHPNDLGHQRIAEVAIAAEVINTLPAVRDLQLAIINAEDGTLRASWSPPVHAVGVARYEFRYFAKGTLTRKGDRQIPPGEAAVAFADADGGTLFAMVRPVYSDGSAGVYAISNSAYIDPPSQTFLHDTFTDTEDKPLPAHIGEIGATWTVAPGFNPTTDNDIYVNRVWGRSALGVYNAGGVPNKADYDVTGVFACQIIAASDTAGLLARSDPKVTTFYFADYRRGTGWRLFKTIGTTSSQLGGGAYPAVFAAGETHVMTLHVRDAATTIMIGGQSKRVNVWVSLDGVNILGAEDYSITDAGRAGMRFATAREAGVGIALDEITAVTV